MSAYIVSRKHIAYLVTAYQRYGEYLPERNPTELGNLLWQENIKSVKYRYHDKPIDQLPGGLIGEACLYTHRVFPPLSLDPLWVIKACECFEYQSCEHPDWQQFEAYRVVASIKSAAIHHLPGYEQAPWGID